MSRYREVIVKIGFKIFCLFVFFCYCKLKIFGKNKLLNGPYIICSNHSSHMDSPALMLANGGSFNDYCMLAAKDYFFKSNKKKSFSAKAMNLIPVEREKPLKAIKEIKKHCENFKNTKQKIILYPEGTRSLSNELLPFKRGAAFLAHQLDLPIVPTYIEGCRNALPKGKYFIKPKTIKVYIGDPIYPSKISNKNNEDRLNKLTNEIYSAIYNLKKNAEPISKL